MMVRSFLDLWSAVFSKEEKAQEELKYKGIQNMFFGIPGVDTEKAKRVWNNVQTQYKQHLIEIWQDLLKTKHGDGYKRSRDPKKQRSFKYFHADDISVFDETNKHMLKIEEWEKTSNQKTNVREMLQVIFVFVFVCYFCFVSLVFYFFAVHFVGACVFVCFEKGRRIEKVGCCCQHHQNGTNPHSQGGAPNSTHICSWQL